MEGPAFRDATRHGRLQVMKCRGKSDGNIHKACTCSDTGTGEHQARIPLEKEAEHHTRMAGKRGPSKKASGCMPLCLQQERLRLVGLKMFTAARHYSRDEQVGTIKAVAVTRTPRKPLGHLGTNSFVGAGASRGLLMFVFAHGELQAGSRHPDPKFCWS
eukprot:1142839-Pelagomonas_calceolata.AAC.2